MRKVTVGFKCHPELKQALINRAQTSGVSLSEYVENLCENQEYQVESEGKATEELVELRKEVSWLRSELSDYESELLGPLFEEYEDQMLTVRLPDGRTSEIHIETPKDLLRAILYSLENINQ